MGKIIKPDGYVGVGLINPRSGANVGSVLRNMGCYDASFLALQGDRYFRGKHRTDVTKEYRRIPIFEVDDIRHCLPYSCVPICIEITDDAVSLPDFVHPARAFYIFGPEDSSVSKEVQDFCAYKVSIPTNQCLNLAQTVGTVLYDRKIKKPVTDVTKKGGNVNVVV